MVAFPVLRLREIQSSRSIPSSEAQKCRNKQTREFERWEKAVSIDIGTLQTMCVNTHFQILNTILSWLNIFSIASSQSMQTDYLKNSALTLKPGGKLVYADFTIPQEIIAKWIATGIVKLLYLCFRLATDIQTNRLPELIWPESLKLISSETRLRGLVTSTIRKKDPD